MDVRWEGGAGNEKRERERGLAGVCDVAQRNMAGYDVWRLKKGQNSIKPYEYEITVFEPLK